MISRKEVLIKMGKIKDPKDVVDDIEKYILEAAEKGETSIKYALDGNFYRVGGFDDRTYVLNALDMAEYIVYKEECQDIIMLTIHW